MSKAHLEISECGWTADEAIEALFRTASTAWPDWQMGDRIDVALGAHAPSGAYVYYARTEITKQAETRK